MLECVINVSEGRHDPTIDAIAAAGDVGVLDVHRDRDHHRSVITVIGVEAARAVVAEAVDRIDLRTHSGAHPRFGAADVVPFVALGPSTPADALAARDDTSRWIAVELGVPCFRYGDGDSYGRTLPEVRREAFRNLAPDDGPDAPHPTAGACAVGARRPLVAYNLWLVDDDLATAEAIAREMRGPLVRTLALRLGRQVQVSCNLIAPDHLGPAQAHDLVATLAAERGTGVARAELVGLVPGAVLAAVPEHRWTELDLGLNDTIEARAAERGWDLG